ncbi:tripartite tricarboxylate transporter substrate binding protein [Orrella sp. JC864]|uniref:Bug family tripartite tricarboxylate transporter substrate binding protein n=1 Tax=Orrella sp. JC864 TaxID=3120298 RepID=UPI00300869A0
MFVRIMRACARHSILAAVAAALASAPAQAAWPDRPLRIIVPFPPGNSSDVSMRLIAEKLGAALGQAVVVENRTGAGGVIGTDYAAKQPADGYTLAMGSTGPMSIAQWLRPGTVPYHAAEDFVPVAAVAWAPQVLVVRADYPVSDFKSFMAYAKEPGRRLAFGSSGNGTTPHLVISQMLNQAGIQATHVPYRGGVQAATDLVGGQVDFISDNVPVVSSLLQSGKVKPLGVTAAQRISSLPDIPTLQEQGLDGFDLQGWILLLAPAGTPQDALDRLRSETAALLKTEEVRERLNGLGLVPMEMPMARLQDFLAQESDKWKQVVEVSGAAEN